MPTCDTCQNYDNKNIEMAKDEWIFKCKALNYQGSEGRKYPKRLLSQDREMECEYIKTEKSNRNCIHCKHNYLRDMGETTTDVAIHRLNPGKIRYINIKCRSTPIKTLPVGTALRTCPGFKQQEIKNENQIYYRRPNRTNTKNWG